MIAGWMVWSVFVAVVLGLAARALEAILELWRLPRRGVWAGAMAVTAGATAAGLWPMASGRTSDVGTLADVLTAAYGSAGAAGEALAPTSAPGPFDAALTGLSDAAAGVASSVPVSDAALLWAWAAATGIVLAVWIAGFARLRSLAAAGTPDTIEGVPVARTSEAGPAVAGLLRPRILWPAWADALEPRGRRTILAHEREHVAARDPALLAAGLAVATLCPWNPAIWWQYRRLRRAVEFDCDRRVLGAAVDRDHYASLLLDVAERRAPRIPAVALVTPDHPLRDRIHAMTRSRPNHPKLRSVALGAAAIALALVACEMPVPVEVVDEESPEGRTVRDASVEASPSGTFQMRGNGELLAGGRPLVFVDGERLEGGVRGVTPDGEGGAISGGLDGLRPEDIARIEVLKGEAALEKYGEEAADGVILIETKDGAGGR